MSCFLLATDHGRESIKLSDCDHDLAALDVSGDPPAVTFVTRAGEVKTIPLRLVIGARIMGRALERGERVIVHGGRAGQRDLRRENIEIRKC